MRNNMLFARFVSLIVAVFFIYQGILVFLQGDVIFAIVWLLICSTILISSVKSLYQGIKTIRFHRRSEGEEAFSDSQESSWNVSFQEKSRLVKLEDLYRNHLITREEYEEKRKEILKRL